MKGGFSLESNETAQAYKDGASVFKNNKIGTFTANNASNFISRATTIISSADVKTKALKEGNTEIESSNAEILKLEKPSWTTGWTRFPTKGN
jgi:tagatose-1,6-bisphosphate aldolase